MRWATIGDDERRPKETERSMRMDSMKMLLVMAVLAVLARPCAGATKAKAASPGDAGWMDVTAPMDPATMPVYPGDAPMKLTFLHDMRKGDGFTLSQVDMGLHTGTHVDAPMHFVREGATLDQVPLEKFLGPVRVIDCSPDALAVDAAELNQHAWRGAKRVFFRTRNSRNHWMTDVNFHKDFTYVAPDAAQLLADAGVELVGIDYISMEKFHAETPRTHWILLGKGIPIIEGLDLRDVAAGDYELMLLPMKVMGHEAAPVRALLKKK